MSPRVSVVMASYNGAAFLPETLASLKAQSFADWELVVADDRSQDGTRALIAADPDPRIRLVELPQNQGPVHARNHAFAATRGAYIAGLDQDDLSHPERFARQIAFLDANPDAVLVSTAARFVRNGLPIPSPLPAGLTPDLIDWLLLTRNPLVWSSVMFRADAARQLHPFERPERRFAEDFDLYQRLRPFGRIAQIEEPLTDYRVHGSGASQKYRQEMYASAAAVLEDAHARLGFGDAGEAMLIARHVMGRQPVPDIDTLTHVFEVMTRLQNRFLAAAPRDPDTRARIGHDISQLWWRVCRAALRTGALPLRKAIAARPEGVEVRLGHPADLVLSRIVGRMRALRS